MLKRTIGKYGNYECSFVMEKIKYTREMLISICERSVVPLDKWDDRGTPRAQTQLGKATVTLKAGCPFRVIYEKEKEGDVCVTDDHIIWLYIKWPSFHNMENGDDANPERWNETHFYLPTEKRLKEREGKDWY